MNLTPTVKRVEAYRRLVTAVSRASTAAPNSGGVGVERVDEAVDAGTSRAAVRALCAAYADTVQWRLIVPGNRAPKLPAQTLLEILARHGIDLLADKGIRPKILAALTSRFMGVVPSRGAMNAVASGVIIDAIVARFRPGYGFDTGRLRSMVAASGYIQFVR